MPAAVEKRGKKWVVLSHKGAGGKVLGAHESKGKARKQQMAINASLRRQGSI
jgi:hypothetical protein